MNSCLVRPRSPARSKRSLKITRRSARDRARRRRSSRGIVAPGWKGAPSRSSARYRRAQMRRAYRGALMPNLRFGSRRLGVRARSRGFANATRRVAKARSPSRNQPRRASNPLELRKNRRWRVRDPLELQENRHRRLRELSRRSKSLQRRVSSPRRRRLEAATRKAKLALRIDHPRSGSRSPIETPVRLASHRFTGRPAIALGVRSSVAGQVRCGAFVKKGVGSGVAHTPLHGDTRVHASSTSRNRRTSFRCTGPRRLLERR
jgi:hypothetical protein